jgi:hypothetical protein
MGMTPIPKPEVRGVGAITYRCAACGGPTTEPVFVPPLPLTIETKTYHKEHAPNGR